MREDQTRAKEEEELSVSGSGMVGKCVSGLAQKLNFVRGVFGFV